MTVFLARKYLLAAVFAWLVRQVLDDLLNECKSYAAYCTAVYKLMDKLGGVRVPRPSAEEFYEWKTNSPY